MQFKGYFAVTSATVQGGSSLRVWADVGIASFEGGFEFNAIIYIKPKFHFECDMHIYAGVQVFGIDFASVDIYGQFEGPGRWHIIGRAEVHTPWPLPDFHFHVDEAWGEDQATTVRRLKLVDELRPELENAGNWSAQLPPGSDAFATFAKLPPPADGDAEKTLLAHPNAVLQFVQNRMPLAKKLDKLGSDAIDGEALIAIDSVLFGATPPQAPDGRLQHSFAAAQFFERNEDDLLAKPSFEPFEAGFSVGQSEYLFGAMASDVFDYEERNLSTPTAPSFIGRAGLSAEAHAAWGVSLGAANRSPRRRAQALRPEVDRKIAVNPPHLQTLDSAAGTMKGTALAGAAATSVWHAQDAIAASARNVQVVEAFETVEAF
jgi:hypothetical protein